MYALSLPCHPTFYAGAFPFSIASIFLLAAKIISSLLLCKFACRSFLSVLHAFAFNRSPSPSPAAWSSFPDKLYRVIRSGCEGFAAAGLAGVVVVVAGVGRLNDGGAKVKVSYHRHHMLCLIIHTISSPLPPSIRSVVAAALPPFRCKSHAMSRLLSCGNICATWSICAGFMRVVERWGVARVWGAEGLLKYHRMARTVTMRNTMTCGTFMDCSAMVARGGCEVVRL